MSNDTSEPMIDEAKVKQGFYTVVFVLGTLGNVLVLIVVAGRRERRTVNDIFIVNLAISDLTYLILCLPTNIYFTVGKVPAGFYCWFVWPMMTVTICLSIFTLTSMAVHRCRVILNPFQPDLKHRYVVIWIVVIWLMGIVVVIPMILATKIQTVEPYGCVEDWPSIKYRKGYTACLFIAQYALPLTIIAVEYVRIGIDLFRPKGPKARGDDAKRQRANRDPARRKENMQVIKTLAMIVMLFALTMLPAQLGWMLLDFGGPREVKIGRAFVKICEWSLYTHACLNPIVYGSLTKHYRAGYIKYLSMIFCCRWRVLYRSLTSETNNSQMRSSSPIEETQEDYQQMQTKTSKQRCIPVCPCAKNGITRKGSAYEQNGHVIGGDESVQPSVHEQTDRLIDNHVSEHVSEHVTEHVTDKNENKIDQRERSVSTVTEKESSF